MAYAATITFARAGRHLRITIAETEGAAGSEATISALTGYPPDILRVGQIRGVKCIRTSGAAATVDPILGTATNPSGANVVWTDDNPRASVDQQWAPIGPAFLSPTNTLYHRTRVNAGADNVVITIYDLILDWGDQSTGASG